MIIVKITIFLVLITVFATVGTKIWASSNPKKLIKAYVTEEFPKWLYLYTLLLFFDVTGILASAIYLLFIR